MGIIFISFALALIGGFILSVHKESTLSGDVFKPWLRFTGYVLVSQLFLFGFFLVAQSFFVESSSRNRLKDLITQAGTSAHFSDLSLDTSSSSLIIRKLLSIKHVGPHKSSPKARRAVTVYAANDTLHLDIAQDSNNPEEYWVFWDDHTNDSEIGRFYADSTFLSTQ